MEMVAEAKVLIVYQVCEKCSEGLMERNGSPIFATNPPQYPHKCDKCGYRKSYPISYPYQKLVPIEPPREMVGREND